MTDDTPRNADARPLAVLARVDQVCDRFEAAWPDPGQQAPRPRIEDYVGDTPEPERSQLLTQLLGLEVEYRRAAGENPLLWDYQARFPNHAEVVHRVFTTLDTVSAQSAAPTPAADAAPLPLGLFPPGYEILNKVGRGGQADVYQARQHRPERLVALKVLREEGQTEPGELERFRREAGALARLQHPNIVQVFEVGEHQGKPFFSLEYCSGGNLDQYLRGTPLPPHEAAALVETLARAMHAGHQQQVVHRDLKPANVLLSPVKPTGTDPEPGKDRLPLSNYIPKVTDFGLAKRLDDVAGPSVSGAIMGTPSYMAPEQAQGRSKEAGPAADVYALGAILYECLTGRPPFKAPTQLETLLQVLNEEPVPPRKLQSKTPRDLETICLKCLTKERARRYATAEKLAEDLHRFLEGKPIEARPVGRLERARMWARRNPVVAKLLGAVAAALLLGAGVSTYFAIKASNAIADRSDLVKNPRVLLEVVDRMEPKEAAAALAQASAETTDLDTLQKLAQRLSAVADHLAPNDTPQAAAALAAAMATTTDPSALRPLARGLAAMAVRMEPKEGATTLTQALAKTADRNALRELGRGLAAVATRLGPKDAVVTLTQAMATTKDPPDALRELGRGLAAVAARLGPKDAVVTLTQAMATTKDPDALRELGRGLAAVAARLGPKDAASAAIALAHAMAKTTYSYALRELGGCLAAVAARLGPKDTVVTLTQAMAETTDRDSLRELGRVLAAVATRLGPKDAVVTLTQAMAETTDRDALRELGRVLAAVAARLGPKDAAVCGQAATTLTQALAKTADPNALRELGRGLAAVAARLEPKDAASAAIALAHAMAKTTYSYALRELGGCLAAVAARLGPKEAAQVAATLTQALAETTDSDALRELARGLAAVAGRLEAKEAAATLKKAIAKTTDSLALKELKKGLSAVAARNQDH
jgi:serine/threonine protein kinase